MDGRSQSTLVGAGGEASVEPGQSTYQLTLAGLILPVPAHLAFNAVSAACVMMLGHPVAAAVLFVSASAFDVVLQLTLRRWLAAGDATPPGRGFRQLAALSAVRVCVYLAPVLTVALSGGAGELIFFAFQLCGLVAVGLSAGALSRLIFWSFVAPALLAATMLVVSLLPAPVAVTAMLSLASMTLILNLISR
ncbi:hypothetical protein, partial [Phenylobacterium sp.]|uniref:hypothetical protein n=1 Tax=Phenylobacterium sp. TaxID=1871053 RepID=UPI002FDF13C1